MFLQFVLYGMRSLYYCEANISRHLSDRNFEFTKMTVYLFMAVVGIFVGTFRMSLNIRLFDYKLPRAKGRPVIKKHVLFTLVRIK